MISTAAALKPPVDDEERSPHYIETSLVGRPLRTLKHGNAFAVMDSYGDMGLSGPGPEGLFFNDTRFLSRYVVLFESARPLLLGSVVQDDNVALSVDCTNPDLKRAEQIVLGRDTIAISRTKFLWKGGCYERLGFLNYDAQCRRCRIDVSFGADFHDLFEVRGMPRGRRGTQTASAAGDTVELRYLGLDNVRRTTRLRFSPMPDEITADRASFVLDLDQGTRGSIFITVTCEENEGAVTYPFAMAYRDRRRDIRKTSQAIATVTSSNDLFDQVCCRATADLYMLVTQTEHGPYPYAGIPWYSTAFGRDGLITAMLMLTIDPRLARGVLNVLANLQAKTLDPAADAQPGKILHETRNGEMARLGEVPFRLYYGSVDATPLFVMLAGLYFERTGDIETIRTLWPNIQAALAWIDNYGDIDGDGFVEYARETDKGLANQGWKDSFDSIFHADGVLAEGPIALCEVQGYVYAAKHHAARLADELGDALAAKRLRAAAERLRVRFEDAFWSEEIGTYVLALDGAKQQCRVRSSNAGHALFAGIASPQRAQKVADELLHRRFFSGWGIRTIAEGEARYNPISYHNGSIWPHDNALIAMGFAKYGLNDAAATVFGAMFDAGIHQDLCRLPELFCGFVRKRHRGPTAYPVACAPQAWAAAATFALLAASLGLKIEHETASICFTRPVLPPFLDHLILRDVSLGDAAVDLQLDRYGVDVTVKVLRRVGTVAVTVVK